MSNAAFFDAWLAAWSGGDAEALLRFYHPHGVYQDPACPQGLQGHVQQAPYFRRLLAAYPGWRWQAEGLYPAEAGWTLRWRVSWPEAWRAPVQGLDWITLAGRLITRNEVYFDACQWPEPAREWHKPSFVVSTDARRLQRPRLQALLNATYWAAHMTPAQLEQRIHSSVCFGLYHETRLIGFARALTDHHTLAYLADVVVDAEWRGQGLGKWLVACALAHPQLQPMRRWLLKTRDAHGLYRQLGYHALAEPEGWLERLATDSP